MKNIVCMILLMLACVAQAAAPTASIEKVWLEHNAIYNGRTAMKVHCKTVINGLKGREARYCVWIKDDAGNFVKLGGPSLTNNAGQHHYMQTLKPGYESTRFDDIWIAPLVEHIHMRPGKNDYTVVVTINDSNGNCLAYDESQTFTGTVPGNAPSNTPAANSNGVKTWREELGYGGFVIVNQYPNGYVTRTRWRACPNCRATRLCSICHGTRVCNSCNGRGGIVSAGYGTWIPCMLCGQTGMCGSCKGTGACYCNSSEYPGYVIGGTSTIAPDGAVNRDDVDYDTGGGGSRHDSDTGGKGGTVKKTCPDCGGTRLYNRGQSPEYARPTSQLMGKYHAAGSKCEWCGYYDEHWHSKCATCKHYPGTTNPYR